MSSPVPPDVVSAYDYERYARARLPDDVWAYISGAGADGITQRRNRTAFDELELAGRVLAPMAEATTATKLLGISLPFPILLAPVAHQRLVHPDCEIATALGASACNAAMCVSTLASVSLEEIANTSKSPLIFQLYMQQSHEHTLQLIRRAESAGYLAIMVTVDVPVNGVRNDEQRAGFRLPPHVRAVNIEGIPQPASKAGPGESPVFKGLLSNAPTWSDIEWLRSQTTLPLLVKGISHPQDAMHAVECGVEGIVVSNHGGRALDTLPSSLDALKIISERVNGRASLLLDGGVRRGTDVLKAIALGADAVLIGQPLLHALSVAGAVGVLHLLTIMRAELEAAMALTGCRSINEITPDVLWNSVISRS